MSWTVTKTTRSRKGHDRTKVVYKGAADTAMDYLRQKQYWLKPMESMTVFDDSGWPIITKRGLGR